MCPDVLQFMHQKMSLLVSRHSSIRWSLPHVPHAPFWLHSAARCLAVSNWHLRHLLGSFRILLAHTLLPAITTPSLIALFAALFILKRAIKCTDFWPVARLCVGLIHLVYTSSPSSSPELCSILLFSASASGLCVIGTNSTITAVALSLTTALLPNPAVNASFSFLIHLAVSGLSSSYTTPPLLSFFASTTLSSVGPWDNWEVMCAIASLALATNSRSLRATS